MAFGVKKDDDAREGAPSQKDELKKLKEEIETLIQRIASMIGTTSDLDQLSREKRARLRKEYADLAQLCKQVAKRTTNSAEREKYTKLCEQARNEAATYGSIMTQASRGITLDDVKGLEHVKDIARTFMFMVRNPEIMKAYHMEGGLGLLMYGAPGTGKSMIAEAIATELDMPLFVMTPADIFKSYVGESEQAVKQIFQEIAECDDGAILFVDECESIFSRRGANDQDYKAAVTTELLQRINGFGVDGSKRILIGATNRPDKIDPAYLRHKRFSHLVHITPPDTATIEAIVSSKLKGVPQEEGLVAEVLHMFTVNSLNGYYSAADICGIVEDACRMAIEQMVRESRNLEQYVPLNREMFERAFAHKPPSISSEALQSYDSFAAHVDEL